jgi:hypothetical protein
MVKEATHAMKGGAASSHAHAPLALVGPSSLVAPAVSTIVVTTTPPRPTTPTPLVVQGDPSMATPGTVPPGPMVPSSI